MAAGLPHSLKAINSFLKLAKEYDKRDSVVSYLCRMFAVQKGIKLDSKTPECKKFLFGLMDQLEATKVELTSKGNESVSNDIVGQAHLENIAVSLFSWADGEDRQGIFNKNVVKAFYSSSLLFEVLTQFGDLTDECKAQQRYAKWKATEIHRCMQNGETPKPGPVGSEFENDFETANQTKNDSINSQNTPYPSGDFQPNISSQSFAPVPAPRKPSYPTDPTPTTSFVPDIGSSSGSTVDTSNVDFNECSKYCKYAMSALNYEDVDTAIENLTKALTMLQASKR